ncbi:NGFI-A-binding protein 2 [Xenopus tropicalis]|nr:NGFI-A-binding protein 2 [Xenopus tropicalis]AAI59130.1 LOC100145178 protein [Xenopus tropicalis]|eukprot:NP_001120141.1 NGFI-A-binding protein 2 [Xenopus tropicalis]
MAERGARAEELKRPPKARITTDPVILPRTLGELQLYRVLQRANLLGYYDTFIQQGGDDVQQLCEAGEDEFLEIMSLVGMATKPLHVRRLQKALRDWATNPGLFNQPALGNIPVSSSIPLFKISETVGRIGRNTNGHLNVPEVQCKSPGNFVLEQAEKISPSQLDRRQWTAQISPELDDADEEEVGEEENGGDQYSSPGERLEPELAQVVSDSVDRLMKGLPRGDISEARSMLKLNKKLGRSLGHIFQMGNGSQRKEREIRRHSAIYGRSESKRREGKRLTLHELTINEAAAQCCMRDNTLLLRRVELFSLARQAARESSYLASLKCSRPNNEELGASQPKILKQEAVEMPLQLDTKSGSVSMRHSVEEGSGSMSGESMDGSLQAVAIRIPTSPSGPTDLSLNLSHPAPWSRQILQQTLMDEGLRLARLVSRDRMGRLSLCLPGTPHISECDDGGSESCPSLPVSPQITELRTPNCKGQDEEN